VVRKLSGSVSISLKQIYDTYEKDLKKMRENNNPNPQSKSKAKSKAKFSKDEPRGADPDAGDLPPKKKSRQVKKRNPITITSLLGRVNPIKFSYSNDLTKGNSGITGSDSSKIYKDVVYKYRYGFVDYYTLPTQSFESSIAQPMKNTMKEKISISSGVKLAKTLSLRLNYAQNTSTGRDYAYKTSSNEFFDTPFHIVVYGDTLELSPYDSSASRNYIPLGETGKEGFAAPDYSLNWTLTPSQIPWLKNRIEFIKKISINHKMAGKETIRYEQRTDQFPYYMEVSSASYTLNFSPLIKVGMTFKNNMTANFAFNKTISYSHQGDVDQDYLNSSVTKNNQDNITFGLSYSYNKGITIPVPFLKKVEVLNLENDISFQLQGKYGFSKKMVKEISKLEYSDPIDHRINWEIEPKLKYSFSKNIDAQLFFKYGQRVNLNQQTEEGDNATDDYKDFGLTVIIKIRG
jgi:hypothetical protein